MSAGALALAPVVALLGAAIVVVPLFRRLGLDPVLGYLAAGLLVGPFGFALFHDPDAIIHFAELGVVMFLFIIGLEMQPSRLWGLRGQIFGLGVVQVAVAGAVLTGAAMLFGYGGSTAFIFAIGFTMTSTAIVFQMLNARRQMATPKGQRIVSILLLEDLAIVPLLALLGFMAAGEGSVALSEQLWSLGVAIGAVALLIVIGLYLLNPVFDRLANSGVRELMTAAALLVVLGASWLMELGGLSMAMGAFLAGVLLSESRFRHQLEADIEPFRGLLLGLFFMGVGMALDLAVIAERWPLILALVTSFMLLKGIVIYGVGRLLGSRGRETTERAAIMMQGGEFAFVIFATAATLGLIGRDDSAVFATTVILSMILTPFLMMAHDRLIRPARDSGDDLEHPENLSSSVLLIGFGRMGQLVSQPLLMRGFEVTIVDNDPASIREAARFGFKVYYGDGSRLDVLHAAGLHSAQAAVVCVDDREAQLRITEQLHHECPQLPVLVRARDRQTAIALQQAGATVQVRETLHSALKLGEAALLELGVPSDQVLETLDEVRRRDQARLQAQVEHGVLAGSDLLSRNTAAVTPEPMVAPLHAGQAVDARTAELLQSQKPDAP